MIGMYEGLLIKKPKSEIDTTLMKEGGKRGSLEAMKRYETNRDLPSTCCGEPRHIAKSGRCYTSLCSKHYKEKCKLDKEYYQERHSRNGFAILELIIVVCLLVSGGLLAVYFCNQYQPAPISLPKAPEIAQEVPQAIVTTSDGKVPAPVVAYSATVKKRVTKTYGLTIKGSEHIADAVVLPKDCGTVIVTYDDKSGAINTKLAPTRKPWLARESTTELSLAVGYRGANRISRLSVRHDFLQAKDLHLGVIGTVDSDGVTFGGVGITWRF